MGVIAGVVDILGGATVATDRSASDVQRDQVVWQRAGSRAVCRVRREGKIDCGGERTRKLAEDVWKYIGTKGKAALRDKTLNGSAGQQLKH